MKLQAKLTKLSKKELLVPASYLDLLKAVAVGNTEECLSHPQQHHGCSWQVMIKAPSSPRARGS